MDKGRKIWLFGIVAVLVVITAAVAVNSQNSPIILEQQQYSEEQASARLDTLKEAQTKKEIEVIPMRFFTEEIRPDDGFFAVTAITTMRQEDIAAVSFRAVNSSVPDLEKWYDAEREGNGRYRLTGSAADLGNLGGTYTIEAYITPAGGGERKAGKAEIEMDLQNYFYSESLGEEKQSLVLVGPKAGAEETSGVRFKVWSVDEEQDDMQTYTAQEDPAGVWKAEINLEDFSGRGDFIANAYAVYGGPETETEEAASTSEEEEAGKDAEATSTSEEEEAGKDAEATSTSEEKEAGKDAEATSTSEEEEAGKEAASTSEEKEAGKEAEEAASTSEEKEAGKETEAASTSEEKEAGKETETASTSEEKEAGKETEAASTSEEKEAGKETEAASTSEEKEAGKDAEASSTSEEKEAGKETENEIEIGIASARFELLPDLSKIPEGKGKVVTEGKRVYVKVPEILQTPELPTGCESVALTIVLNSMGYELEKTDIMKNYLEKGTDMATSYVGDPFSTRGAGCFPPAIAAAANKFLDENEDDRKGYNITGTDIEELCDYIDKGTPAIIWSSMYMADPAKAGGTYSYQGQTYEWYRAEHCVVLYGYDKEKKVYLVSDPLVGLVERDTEAFKRIYDQIGQYAVVIY